MLKQIKSGRGNQILTLQLRVKFFAVATNFCKFGFNSELRHPHSKHAGHFFN